MKQRLGSHDFERILLLGDALIETDQDLMTYASKKKF